MITCTVCGKENSDLDTTCVSCKSFLQGRVDALNLFETIWGLVESPRATFRKIVLARHKNYVILLALVSGITVFFEIAWLRNLGDRFVGLVPLVGTGLLLGPILGIVTLIVMALLLGVVSRVFGGKFKKRNIFAALAYALVPFAIAAVFIVPLEFAAFGFDYFGTNPPPSLIRPVEYYLILVLKSVLWLWTAFMVVEAVMAANAFDSRRRLPVAASVLCIILILVSVVKYA